MFIAILALKALTAGTAVLTISLIAERVSPRVAGIIAGAPLGALMSFYMLGLEQGVGFVTDSVAHAVAGMSGVLAFTVGYRAVTLRAGRYNIAKSVIGGLLAFLATATALETVDFVILTALPLTIAVCIVAGYHFRRDADIRVANPARLTLSLMALRAGLAAVTVVTMVSIAAFVGTRWTGVLMGFPFTLLPTMLIIHLTYSREHVLALLNGFPLGLGSVLTYLVTVPWTFPALGVHLGTLTSLAAAMVYLVLLSLVIRWLRRR